jgi:PmbA protein
MQSNSTPSSTIEQQLAQRAENLELGAHHLMQFASKKGADRSKIAVSASFEQRLAVESGHFTLANSLASQSVSLLLHKDQKKSSASANTTDLKTLEQTCEDCLALASFSVADPYLIMPSADEAPKATPLDHLFDNPLSSLELYELKDFAQTVLSRLTKDKRVALDKCDMAISSSFHGLYNSLGVMQKERQTALSWSFFGMAVDGDEVSGFDYDGRHVYRFEGALQEALRDADRFVEKVIGNLYPKKAKSYKGQVLLSPRAVEEILLETLLFHAAGTSVMDKKSLWMEAINQKVATDSLSLIDRPHESRLTGATAFDSDGLPTREQTILEHGVLKMHLLDCYSAHRLSKKSNGMAGGPFALTMSPGKETLENMRHGRGDLLLVDRFSGNIDTVRGDFSGVAKSSRMLHNGSDQGPVTETMIAGNIFEILKTIPAISNHQELVSGAMLLPWVLIDQVSVSAG